MKEYHVVNTHDRINHLPHFDELLMEDAMLLVPRDISFHDRDAV